MRKSIRLSQNFLKNKSLISNLIEISSLSKTDIVFEIGAGDGAITEALLQKCGKVVAFEVDDHLSKKLIRKFTGNTSLEVNNSNFLEHSLPTYPYKVFSNIPFNITAALIKKLTQATNPPEDTYLIIQKEAAKKYVGKPYHSKNSQLSILIKPLFSLEVAYEFKKNDFYPKPNVDTVMLRITKKQTPLVESNDESLYDDFVVFTFNQFKPTVWKGMSEIFSAKILGRFPKELVASLKANPSELDFEIWLKLFEFYLHNADQSGRKRVEGSLNRLLKEQANLDKVHRTRTAKNWRESIRK